MHHLGREGYQERADRMWKATEKLVAVIDAAPSLRMLGRPDMNLFAFTTVAEGYAPAGDIFELADRLTECGWHVQPTYAFGPSPAHIHLTVDPGNAARVDAFIADLETCLVDLPPSQDAPAAVVAMLSQLAEPGGEAIDAAMLMGQLGIADGQLPGRAAMIHRLINAASPVVRERLLILFIGELFS
jgi:glutamate/tyrosine decarboxylase-like PLP-dependent enzyme